MIAYIYDRHLVPSLFINLNICSPNIFHSILTAFWCRFNSIWFYDDIASSLDMHISIEVTWETRFNLIKECTNLIHWDRILSFHYELLDLICWDVFFTFLEQSHSSTCIWNELIVVLEDSLCVHIRDISVQFINQLDGLINAQFLLYFVFK